jgi:hypothetical protein
MLPGRIAVEIEAQRALLRVTRGLIVAAVIAAGVVGPAPV